MNYSVNNMKVFLYLIISLGLLLSSCGAHASSQQKFFQNGINAFNRKDYHGALTDFALAQKAGMKETKLYYNIGVCYYKLEKYDKANNFFNIAARDRRYRQLTSYNLGLIALKQRRKQAANKYFKNAISATGNLKINELARRMLKKNSGKKTDSAAITWNSGINLALGYDDNVTSATNTTPSLRGDHYTQLFAYTDWYGLDNYVLDAYFLQLKYANIHTGNFSQLSAGIRRSFRYNAWRLTPHFQAGRSRLSSGDFQQQFDFKVSGQRTLDNKRYLKLRFRYTKIDSLNHLYDYLQGDRQQIRADYYAPTSAGKLRLRYVFELNHRQNTATANYSPTRHGLQAKLSQRLSHGWMISEEVQYRLSHYDSIAGVTRKDDRRQFTLVAERHLQTAWLAGLRYSHTNNLSNVAIEQYTRNDFQVYLNYNF